LTSNRLQSVGRFQGARLRQKSEQAETGDGGPDTSEESEIEEELGFFSLLDGVNPYITFGRGLQSAFLDDFSLFRVRLLLN